MAFPVVNHGRVDPDNFRNLPLNNSRSTLRFLIWSVNVLSTLGYFGDFDFGALIDIQIEVPGLRYQEQASKDVGESSNVIRARVNQARNIQLQRFDKSKIHVNAQIVPKRSNATAR